MANEIEEHYLESFNLECPYCHTLHWLAEKHTKSPKSNPEYAGCCHTGEVALDLVDPIPNELKHLYEASNCMALEFRHNIQQYNKVLAFTSTGGSGQLVGTSFNGCSPPIYKIQGKIHHQIRSIIPEDNQPPVYSQMYIYNHDKSLQYYLQNNPQGNQMTMNTLVSMLEWCHPFIDVYQQAYELTQSMTVNEYQIQLDF